MVGDGQPLGAHLLTLESFFLLFLVHSAGEVSTDVCDKLVQLCTALSTLDAANFENNFATANQLQASSCRHLPRHCTQPPP
jgi:hypothetical protein